MRSEGRGYTNDIVRRPEEKGGTKMIDRIKIKVHERGLLWREGQLIAVLRPGVHWYLDPLLKLRLQIVSARDPWLLHKDLDVIVKSGELGDEAIVIDLHDYERALVWIDGRFAKILEPGLYALWTVERKVRVEVIDARPMQLLHAELSAILRSPGASALLELREAVGAKDLDTLLVSKDALASELSERIRPRAAELGIAIVNAGVRDIILPGEMKELMNKVTEAKKAAEASLITRREETASMRMQANTAKILESNPTLMKLKELEVLEKVADKANLTVLLGDEGL